MPRKKNIAGETCPLIVRIPVQIDRDLRLAADLLGVNVSNLVRLVLIENIPTYIDRGLDARKRAEQARARAEQADRPGSRTTGQGKAKSQSDDTPQPGEQGNRSLDI